MMVTHDVSPVCGFQLNDLDVHQHSVPQRSLALTSETAGARGVSISYLGVPFFSDSDYGIKQLEILNDLGKFLWDFLHKEGPWGCAPKGT